LFARRLDIARWWLANHRKFNRAAAADGR
jgi:hypothetical protein